MKTRQLSPISMLEIWGDMGACLRDTLHGGDPGVFIVALSKVTLSEALQVWRDTRASPVKVFSSAQRKEHSMQEWEVHFMIRSASGWTLRVTT